MRACRHRPVASLLCFVLGLAGTRAFTVRADIVLDCAVSTCKGAAWGYVGMAGTCELLGIVGQVAGALAPPKRRREVACTEDDVSGHWVIDSTRSESLEPFLIAVGAPRLVAKLVGTKGKAPAAAAL